MAFLREMCTDLCISVLSEEVPGNREQLIILVGVHSKGDMLSEI